jgi:hypothetical protein
VLNILDRYKTGMEPYENRHLPRLVNKASVMRLFYHPLKPVIQCSHRCTALAKKYKQQTLDPRKFIDREFEQELFAELLLLKDGARILAIRDRGGMGKSHLLEKFQHRCRTNRPDRIPISLVELDQLSDNTPLALIKLAALHHRVWSYTVRV